MSHVAIYKWMRKYVGLMQRYLEKMTPNVADTWRADELYIKVRGNPKYLYALMDDQTRFWIAQQVADTKYISDIMPLRNAKETTQKRPNTFITGDAPNFHVPCKKEFTTHRLPTTRHISHI
jgi:transposase-like protein